MGFVEIVKSLSDVGVLVMCAALIIWQVINDRIGQKKNQDSLKNFLGETVRNLEEQNKMMLGQIIKKVDAGHMISDEEDNNISKIEKELEMYLTEILEKTNANRASLFRYHNGGKDYNGRSFLRMSMTNEVVKCGTALIQPQSQNIFRSMFYYLIRSLEDNGYDFIDDVEDIKNTDTGFYRYLRDFDIKAKYSVALYGFTGKIIGFISIDFANKEDTNIEKIKDCLENKKVKIETLLNL